MTWRSALFAIVVLAVLLTAMFYSGMFMYGNRG